MTCKHNITIYVITLHYITRSSITHLSGEGRQHLQSPALDLGPLALDLAELIPVRDPVQRQDVELLVFRYVPHCTVIFFG